MEWQRYSYFVIEFANSTEPYLITDAHGYIMNFNSFEEAEKFAKEYELKNYIICDEHYESKCNPKL